MLVRNSATLYRYKCIQYYNLMKLICSEQVLKNITFVNGCFHFTLKAFPWAATLDGEFLVDSPYNLLKAGKYHRKDALLGANQDEGSFWVLPELPGFSRFNNSLQNLTMFRSAVDVIAWDLTTQQVLHSACFTSNKVARFFPL